MNGQVPIYLQDAAPLHLDQAALQDNGIGDGQGIAVRHHDAAVFQNVQFGIAAHVDIQVGIQPDGGCQLHILAGHCRGREAVCQRIHGGDADKLAFAFNGAAAGHSALIHHLTADVEVALVVQGRALIDVQIVALADIDAALNGQGDTLGNRQAVLVLRAVA